MHWNTNKIKDLLNGLPIDSVAGPGGDVDTYVIILGFGKDEHIFVSGFTTKGDIGNPDDCEIEYIEVEDGQDSRGGLNSSTNEICHLYAEVVSRLRTAGFTIVPCMEDYF